VRVRTWKTLPRAKYCKKSVKGVYPFLLKIIKKIAILAILTPVSPHVFKATTVKFGMRLWTWDTLPMPNFVKKRSKNRSRGLPVLHCPVEVMHIDF